MNQVERFFIVLGHTAAITPDFTLNDLPGNAGRLDILCRCVTAAFCLSHGIRADAHVYLILRDQITVRFDGAKLKRLNPDERSTGALIKHALEILPAVLPGAERESTPGVFISLRGLEGVLQDLESKGVEPFVLHEQGQDIGTARMKEPAAFILSDHQDFTLGEETRLRRCQRLSLGPRVLHADHCISIVHNELDRRGSDWVK